MKIQFSGLLKDVTCRDHAKIRFEVPASDLPQVLRAIGFGIGAKCKIKVGERKWVAQLVDARVKTEGDSVLTFLAGASALQVLGELALTQGVHSVTMIVKGGRG